MSRVLVSNFWGFFELGWLNNFRKPLAEKGIIWCVIRYYCQSVSFLTIFNCGLEWAKKEARHDYARVKAPSLRNDRFFNAGYFSVHLKFEKFQNPEFEWTEKFWLELDNQDYPVIFKTLLWFKNSTRFWTILSYIKLYKMI